MDKLLQGKTALVTGAASGIGKAVAQTFAREGANVLLSDLSEEAGQKLAEQLSGQGVKAVFVKSDVSDPKQVEALVQAAVDQFGGLHIAVNNAGIGGELATVKDYTLEGWRKIISVNLDSVFYCLKYELAVLKPGGSIVNMASILGQVGTPNSAGYVAAKHAVVGLTQAAALENAKAGVRINAVGPGYIDTPLLQNLPKPAYDGLVALHPIGRLGTADEVAELVLWLASDRASFVTGSYYNVDGGYLAQ